MSHHQCDVIVSTQEITVWIIVLCMKALQASFMVIEKMTDN